MQIQVEYHDASLLPGLTLLCAHQVTVTADELEPIGTWAGSMKIAAMDEQFDLYLETPGEILIENGFSIPLHHHADRLPAKGIGLSVTANLGEMFFAWYAATWLGLDRDRVIHLRTHPNQQTPDFLAELGPLLAGRFGLPAAVPDLWPVEVKSRFGGSGRWAASALSQLNSFWSHVAADDGVFTQPGYGLSVLLRRQRAASGAYSTRALLRIHHP